MFSYLNRLMKKRKKDKGAAIVMVIVALAFVGALVSMILYMSYANYLMKSNDKIAKNNFYSAESALALINAGLQKDITESMAEAYIMSTQLSAGKSDSEISTLFKRFFRAQMNEKITESSYINSDTKYWSMDRFEYYIKADKSMDFCGLPGGQGVGIQSYGETNVANKTNNLIMSDNAMTFQNVNITYVDANGYISVINTDIILNYPDYQTTTKNIGLSLEDFALVANNCLVNDGTYTAPDGDAVPTNIHFGNMTTVKGNVFGGNDGIYVKDSKSLDFADDTADTKDSYDLIANKITVENNTSEADAAAVRATKGVIVSDKHKNYIGDIRVKNNGVLNIDGVSKVKNDLDVAGNDAYITLGGTYFGFGSSTTDADTSSSIMINGANASIDFSALEELKLCGNAFVGATHYDADQLRYQAVFDNTDFDLKSIYHSNYAVKDADSDYIESIQQYDKVLGDPATAFDTTTATVSRNTTDVLTGESIAVKADQMMYLVPADCIGFLHGTNTQVMAKNPLSFEEYEKLTTTYKVENGVTTDEPYYDLYNLSALSDRLENSYHYGVKKVFRRVNGSVLVYLYLDFGSNQYEAGNFFKEYCKENKDSFDQYVNSYVKAYKWNNDLDDNLSIAGNAFTFDANKKVVIKEENISDDEDKMVDLFNNVPIFESNYNGMMHMLTTSTADLTDAQLAYDVYTNLVSADVADASKLGNCEFGVNADASSFDAFHNLTDDSMLKAKTVVGDYYYSAADYARNIRLIVVTGDLYLTCDFEGLAIAGGNIYICSDVSAGTGCTDIQYNSQDVYKILTTAKNENGDLANKIFGSLGVRNYSLSIQQAEATTDMDTAQYLHYSNWKKE